MKHNWGAIVLNAYLGCLMAWMVVMVVVAVVHLLPKQ
jgi:hypothetical protein